MAKHHKSVGFTGGQGTLFMVLGFITSRPGWAFHLGARDGHVRNFQDLRKFALTETERLPQFLDVGAGNFGLVTERFAYFNRPFLVAYSDSRLPSAKSVKLNVS